MIRFLPILTLFSFLFCSNLKGQYGNFISPEGIDWRKDSLVDVVNVIKDNKCIVLSEPNHGYGRAIDAQSCIIKNLIESSDQKVVLFLEASWVNCDRILRLLRSEGEAGIPKTSRYLTSNDLIYWAKTGFWNYICEKVIEGKLELQGFDISGISPDLVHEMIAEAEKIPEIIRFIESIKDYDTFRLFFEPFGWWRVQSILQARGYKAIEEFIGLVTEVYISRGDTIRSEEWNAVLDYFNWIYRRTVILKDNKISNQVKDEKQESQFLAPREQSMSKIFLKKYAKYSDRLIICKMATMHSGRELMGVEGLLACCREPGVRSMMELISQQSNIPFYSICFTTGSGSYFVREYPLDRNVGNPVKMPPRSSLERYLLKKGGAYYFANLEDATWRYQEFTMNVLYDRFASAKWSRHFSAVFYIREMAPLDLLPEPPVSPEQNSSQ